MQMFIRNRSLGLFALLLGAASPSFASGGTVVGAARGAALVANCDLPLDTGGIDFKRGMAEAALDAEAQCGGKARRIGEYRLDPSCYATRIWGAIIVSVGFSADFECE